MNINKALQAIEIPEPESHQIDGRELARKIADHLPDKMLQEMIEYWDTDLWDRLFSELSDIDYNINKNNSR